MRGLLTRLLGDKGERFAARFLRKLGYRIIAKQHKNQFGEIDLIAMDGDQIVFVEVKTRKSLDRGHPSEAVDANKQRKLTTLALTFLKKHKLLEHSARFDVIALVWPQGVSKPEVTHYRNAFEPTGSGQMFA